MRQCVLHKHVVAFETTAANAHDRVSWVPSSGSTVKALCVKLFFLAQVAFT